MITVLEIKDCICNIPSIRVPFCLLQKNARTAYNKQYTVHTCILQGKVARDEMLFAIPFLFDEGFLHFVN
jgi:hypothetical protein